MKKKGMKIVSVILSLMMMMAMTSCSGNTAADKVVMTYVASPLNVPSIVEKQQGKYKDAFQSLGLDFEYSDLDSGADQTAALASGDIQILNAVGGSSVLLAAANGADIVILSMYSRAPEAFCMFSADENIDSPQDLKGLTIAGPKGTNLHELLVAYLATENMTVDDVEYVDMDIPSAVAALDGGSIDAALVGGPAAYNCEKSGKHLVTDGKGLIASSICTATSKEFADANPEIIDAFLKTQNEIAIYINDHTEEALEITAENLDMELSAVKDMYKLYDFSTEITDTDIKQMQTTENFLYNCGMIENHVDVKNLIYGK